MATWIVGGLLLLLVAALAWKMLRDRRSGKGACSCGGNCSACGACTHRNQPPRA